MSARRARLLPSFVRAYGALAPEWRPAVDRALRAFIDGTAAHALRLEHRPALGCWCFRATLDDREAWLLTWNADGAEAELFHVAPHDDYRPAKARRPW